jgi:hypothetical protein
MKTEIIETKKEDTGTIRVADITILQLSRGLYRSTATAFKELISNAYDADATRVRIDTNYPEFDFISCVDNGTGMPIEQFLRYFSEKGIGSCNKRMHKKDATERYGRPIIGRLGIGMLAVGQLCNSFEIESHYIDEDDGQGKAYRGEIILLDSEIPDKEDIIRNDDLDITEIQVGTWKYEIIDYDESKQGFHIYSYDIRRTFRNEMKLSIGDEERKRMSFSLPELHSEFYGKSRRSIRECKPYLEAIWELAILCPLPYYVGKDEYPINTDFFSSEQKNSPDFKRAIQIIRDRQSKFLKDNFQVIFDGIELKRHVQLTTDTETVYEICPIEFDDNVFESRLKFSGYLFAQIPKAIRPWELNGIQIRLRGVGIGGYENTFLKYYKEIETIRSRWVSGEIYVDDGLESALNIDRDSFNEHDEHFKKLQQYIHTELGVFFNRIETKARKRRDEKRKVKKIEKEESIDNIIVEESKGKFKRILRQDLGKDARIVKVNKSNGEIILNTAARPMRSKTGSTYIENIELVYQVAKHIAETDKERDVLFSKIIKKVFDKLI